MDKETIKKTEELSTGTDRRLYPHRKLCPECSIPMEYKGQDIRQCPKCKNIELD